jgi:Acetyltransferases
LRDNIIEFSLSDVIVFTICLINEFVMIVFYSKMTRKGKPMKKMIPVYTFHRATVYDSQTIAMMHTELLNEMPTALSQRSRNLQRENVRLFFTFDNLARFNAWIAGHKDLPVSVCCLSTLYVAPTARYPQGIISHLNTLYTKPNHRRQGLAAQLLHRAVEDARMSVSDALVASPPQHLRTFFQKFGFEAEPDGMHCMFREG